MRKLAALVSFIIKELNFTNAENVSSFHVVDEFQPSGDYVDNGHHAGICLYDQIYTAVIRIENFPAKRFPPALVFGLVSCWVLANDPVRQRVKIEVGADNQPIPLPLIDINDDWESDDTLSIELLVPFREPVFGIVDVTGIFEYEGVKYRLADETLDTEQFEYAYIRNFA